VGGHVRGPRHLPRVCGDHIGAVSRFHEYAPRTGASRRFDVGSLVADPERPREVDVESLAGLSNQTRLRLAAVAVDAVRLEIGSRMMRTVQPGIDARAAR